MVSRNDITGDSIQTKATSNKYRDNYDLIFRKDKQESADTNKEQVATENKDQADKQ